MALLCPRAVRLSVSKPLGVLSSPVLWIDHPDLQEAVGSAGPLEMIPQIGSLCERLWVSASLGHFADMNRSGYDVQQVFKADSSYSATLASA
jgi:hypothetical protein